MKTQAWRRLLPHYPVHGELLPRYSDVDMWQHLNNAALFALQGEVQQRWLRQHLGEDVWRRAQPRLAVRRVATDFLAESHYPAPLATGCRLLAAGPGGFTLGSALFQHGQCTGLQQAHWSAWGDDGQTVPLPEELTAALQALAAAQPALPADEAEASAAQAAAWAGTRPPALPAREALPWQASLPTRFGDADARSLASDFSGARAAEQMRVQCLTELFGAERRSAPTGFMVAHVDLHWLRRCALPGVWQGGSGVLRLGERSMTVRGGLFIDGQCCAVADSVMVVIHSANRRSAALPDEQRARLTPFLLAGAVSGAVSGS